jgi:hypothetical protein
MDREKEDRVRRQEEERNDLSKELRYTQQVVAGELAGWQEWRQKVVRSAVRELARGVLVTERARLESIQRALRKLRTTPQDVPSPAYLNGAHMPDSNLPPSSSSSSSSDG